MGHGLAALRAKWLGLGGRERFGRFEVGLGWLPGSTLGGGQHRRLLEQCAHPVEFDAGGRVQPTEAPDAMKAGGQHVLKETPDQFERFEIDVVWAACGAVPIGPAHPAIGQECQVPVAGGGFEFQEVRDREQQACVFGRNYSGQNGRDGAALGGRK